MCIYSPVQLCNQLDSQEIYYFFLMKEEVESAKAGEGFLNIRMFLH